MPTATVTVTATASAMPTQLANVGPVAVRATALTACPNNLASMGGGTGPERLVDGDPETGWRWDDRRDYAEGNVNTTPTVGLLATVRVLKVLWAFAGAFRALLWVLEHIGMLV